MSTFAKTKGFLITASILGLNTLTTVTAKAQDLPEDCTPDTVSNGDVVTCTGMIDTSSDPDTGIVFNADNVTLNIGTPTTSAEVIDSTYGINVSGSNITINVTDLSTIEALTGFGLLFAGNGLTLNSEG